MCMMKLLKQLYGSNLVSDCCHSKMFSWHDGKKLVYTCKACTKDCGAFIDVDIGERTDSVK